MIGGCEFFKLFLLAIVLIAIVGAGGMYYMAGREAGPAITINSPDKFIGRSTAARGDGGVATGIAGAPTSRSSRTASRSVADLKSEPARRTRLPHCHGDDRQDAHRRWSMAGHPDGRRHAQDVLRPAHRRQHVDARPDSPARSAAGGGRLDPPLHQPRRRGVRGDAGHAGRRRGRRAGRRRRAIASIPARRSA